MRYACILDYKKEEEKGITLIALKYYFNTYLHKDIIVNLDRKEKSIFYIIKLPIYEEKGD